MDDEEVKKRGIKVLRDTYFDDYWYLRIYSPSRYDVRIKIDAEAVEYVNMWDWTWNSAKKTASCYFSSEMLNYFPREMISVPLSHFVAHVVSRLHGDARLVTRVSTPDPLNLRISDMKVWREGRIQFSRVSHLNN